MEVFISVDRARALMFAALGTQPIQSVDVASSMGLTVASPIVSKEAIPPFSNSAMDGFAVLMADFDRAPFRLQVVGAVSAGSVSTEPLRPGCCVRIMTGAPVPPGTEAVVPIEWVEEEKGAFVTLSRKPEVGQHIREAGKDVRPGEPVIEEGRRITPPVIGMLAALGYTEVECRQPPVVAVVTTGDELLEPGESLSPGKIRDSNGPALRAQVLEAGGIPTRPLRARDHKESIREVLEEALDADILVISGGVSVGDYDRVKEVLDDLGMALIFWKVRQRPGKPLAFGQLQGRPVFGLPGNPVSSAMCFDQYVRPAIASMLGRRPVARPRHRALLEKSTPKPEGLHVFARGEANYDRSGRLHVKDTGAQGSNIYSSVLRANCIIHLEEDRMDAEAGDYVDIEWLPWRA